MLFQAAFEFIAAIQNELAVFVIAICAHQLLFGKRGFATGPHKKVASKCSATTAPAEKPSPSRDAAKLAQAVKQSLKAGAGRKQLAAQIREAVQALPEESASAVLADMLKTLGKAANGALLGAVRDGVDRCGLSFGAQLGELLLRSYLSLGMYGEFSEVLAEVKEAGHFKPSTAALALRAAVASGDFEGALAQLPGLAAAPEEEAATPSAAPQGAVQQLAELAAKQAKLPALLRAFRAAAPRLAPAALEAALAAALRRGGAPAAAEVEELGRSAGVDFTPGARGALLRAAGDGERARRLFAEASGSGEAAPEVLAAAAEAALAHRDSALAEDVLRKVPATPTQEVAAAVLRFYAEGPLKGQGTDKKILELWDAQLAGSGGLSDRHVAKLVADASFRCQRPDVLGRLLSAGPVGPAHAALLKDFAAEGRVAEAKQVFEALPEKSALLYNTLLDACFSGARDLKAAEKVLAQAVAENMADAATYNTMIKKHLQRGDFRAVRAVLETMRTAGGNVAPNCVTFNELIDAAIRTSTKAAWDLVEEMKACGLQPNTVTCSILLKGVQRSSAPGEVERAMALAEGVDGPADEVLVSSVCEACVRAGRADLLKRSLRRMRSRVGGPAITGAHTFGSVVRAYGFLGDVDGAWSTWKEMRSLGVLPTSTTAGCMVEALASNGDPHAAHRLLCELSADAQTRPLVNATIYGSVLKGFSHQKEFQRVWAVYEEMLAAGLEVSLANCNALLDACARSGDMERIPPLLQDMARRGIEANLVTYGTVLKAYCQEGRLDRALELLEEMKASKHLQPDEIVYNSLIDGCARAFMFEKGVGILREMQDRGVAPSVYTVSVLAKLAGRCRRPQQAAELCGEISRKYGIRLNVHAHNNLVSAWTQQGRMREAFEAFERMLRDGVWPDVRTYTLLLRGCVNTGDAEGAAGLLRAAAGARGADARISSYDAAKLQLRGGLPSQLADEVLEGIAGKCGDGRLAQQLRWDLRGAKAAAPGAGAPRPPAGRAARAGGR